MPACVYGYHWKAALYKFGTAGLTILTNLVHVWLKNGSSKSRHYEVIALTSHFGHGEIVALKLGRGH